MRIHPPTRSALLIIGIWFVLMVLGLLVYLPGLPGGFVFDDLGSIVYNQAIHLHTLTLDNLYTAMLSSPTGGLMRPLSMLSFALDAYFFGVTSLPFKLTNIFIHLACGLILWFVTREILRAYAAVTRRMLSEKILIWISSAVSAIWLVHPLNLTAVLYSVQRETSLSACFTAAAILCYLVGRRHERDGTTGLLLIWFWTPLLTALGMLCKETAALLPAYLLVTEFTLLGFAGKNGRMSRSAYLFQIVFLAVPLLAAAVYLTMRPQGFFTAWYFGRDFTLYERLLTESRVVLDYFRWAFIPDIRQLALYHDNFHASRSLLDPPTTLACILVVFVFLGAAITLRKRAPLLSFALLWFFAGQLMESTIIPLELMFEHRNYLPIFGLITGITGTLSVYALERTRERVLIIGATACIVLFGSITALRAWEWHSEMSFAQYEVAHQPNSPRALAELGWSYSMYLNVTQDYSVIPYAVNAELKEKTADPFGIAPDISIADIYAVTHDLPKAKQYLKAAAEDASKAEPTATFQFAIQTLRHWHTANDPELRSAINLIFENAVNNPKMEANSCYLAGLLNTYGIWQESNEEIPAAAQIMHKATSLCPGNALLHINFANLLLNYGDSKDARQEVEAARKLHDIRYFGQIALLERALSEESAGKNKAKD